MFDGGVPADHFHRFIASPPSPPPPPPSSHSTLLPPLHHHHHHHHHASSSSSSSPPPPTLAPSTFSATCFDLYPNPIHSPSPLQLHVQSSSFVTNPTSLFPAPHHHQPHQKLDAVVHHHHQPQAKTSSLQQLHHHHHHQLLVHPVPLNLEIDGDDHHQRSIPDEAAIGDDVGGSNHRHHDEWTHDEVLALLRTRSCMETWFPQDFTWQHVSRKLAELGFRKSADECKEKFEEESRSSYTQTPNIDGYMNNKTHRFQISELEEELYNINHGDGGHHHQLDNNNPLQLASLSADKTADHEVQKPIGTAEAEDEEKEEEEEEEEEDKMGQIHNSDDNSRTETAAAANNNASPENINDKKADVDRSCKKGNNRKRKRAQDQNLKYELFKGFCENVVQRLMAQQEEMHNKLLEDMVRREREMVEREEAWKKQEMERMKMELDVRAHEQAIAGDRQATIIEFLKRFTSGIDDNDRSPLRGIVSSDDDHQADPHEANRTNPNSSSCDQQNDHVEAATTSSSLDSHLVSLPACSNNSSAQRNMPTITKNQNPSSANSPAKHQNPNSLHTSSPPVILARKPLSLACTTSKNAASKEELTGKRWPKDEVQALISLRCSLYGINNINSGDDKALLEGSNSSSATPTNKAPPLWERISKKMMELGYDRSAKRCKEKWENINKYFRKTKDLNKKRSLDSRTCPYFHQLSHFYSHGTKLQPAAPVAAPASEEPRNCCRSPETLRALPETSAYATAGSSSHQCVPGDDRIQDKVAAQGDKTSSAAR